MSHCDVPETDKVLAIDVGSSRVKLGRFTLAEDCPSGKPATALPIAAPQLPEPREAISLAHGRNLAGAVVNELNAWIDDNFTAEPMCCLATVQRTVADQLGELLQQRGWRVPRQLTWRDMPLEVRVDDASRVGIDRLLNAVGVNRLRDPEQPAIVVDLGTAGTVDLVAADGAFEGGAILPGMVLTAQALHSGTSTLPEFDPTAVSEPIAPLGKNTTAALAAGIYWGMVGSVRELVERISRQCSRTPQLFVTGGAAPQVVHHLAVAGSPARHVPHLVLSAIRIVAEHLR